MKFVRLSLLMVLLMAALTAPGAFGKARRGSSLGGNTNKSTCPYLITCGNGSSGECCNDLGSCCNACDSMCGETCGGLC